MSKYNAKSIQVLKGLDAVRKRPGMYIGSTDENGLHHLLWEMIDNAMDEVLSKYAKNIAVTLKADKSVVVEDDGRGIPVDFHSKNNTAIEVIFTKLHAGGKFGNQNTYKTSGGLNGVGAAVVNALSDKIIVNVFRNKNIYQTIFHNGGKIAQKTTLIGKTNKHGTEVIFWPNYQFFNNATFNYQTISEHLRESSFLVSDVKIVLKSEITNEKNKYHYPDGMREFIKFINKSKTSISEIMIFKEELKQDIAVNIGIQFIDTPSERILSFVNNIKTNDGGKHEEGFKSGLTKVINEYARNHNLLKKNDNSLDGIDIREGITAVISLQLPEKWLQFVGQTKDKLATVEVKKLVENFIASKLAFWLNQNKTEAYKIVNKAITSATIRNAARKARLEAKIIKNIKNKNIFLSGKLTPAQNKNPKKNELYLVEGDSAGGSAKLGRDRKFQAILPLRGKIINTERAKIKDVLANEEIISIIHTIGTGISSEFNIKKLKYNKIIIMTDADTDGAHIQTLLITFFYRFMKPLIENNKIFVALPPLYKINKLGKNKNVYLWEEQELNKILETNHNLDIQRYKGLGEMNADQLWDTTMNPVTRSLIKVVINDTIISERRISTLMGDKVEPRREWIENNIDFSITQTFIKGKRD